MLVQLEPLIDAALDPLVNAAEPITGALGASAVGPF
jgi:hypothetical protein